MTADRVTPEEGRIAPCPWCGGKAEVSAFRVRCPYCAMMGPSTDRENCIAAWNRVAGLAALGASVSGAEVRWLARHIKGRKVPHTIVTTDDREVAEGLMPDSGGELRRVLILPADPQGEA